jgi:hypothetical protein
VNIGILTVLEVSNDNALVNFTLKNVMIMNFAVFTSVFLNLPKKHWKTENHSALHFTVKRCMTLS